MFESPALDVNGLRCLAIRAAHVLTSLSDADLSGFDDAGLLEYAELLESLRPLLDSASNRALQRIETSGATDTELGMRPAQWLAHSSRIPHRDARRRFSTAAALATLLPAVADALREGRINSFHADHLAKHTNPRNAAAMADAATDMCNRAATVSFARWARNVATDADMYDADGSHNPDNDTPLSKLNMSRTGDLLHLFGPLGRLIENAITTITDQVHDEIRRTPDLGTHVDHNGNQHAVTAPEQRAEALGRLCEQALAVDRTNTRGPRDAVTLVLNPADPDTITDPNGHIVDHDRYRAVLCDPTFHPLVMSINGVPLDAGRDARYANREQRRAAAHRDGGCVFPGCGAPPTWTDAHHVQEWDADHGSTDIANLACLCRFHHSVVHRNGWTMAATHDGWFTFTTPSGRTLHSQRHDRQRAGP